MSENRGWGEYDNDYWDNENFLNNCEIAKSNYNSNYICINKNVDKSNYF